jgi:hypothetical protein
MSVGQQHVTWAETNGGGAVVGDRHDKRGDVGGSDDNSSSRSRSTEQLDRLLRGLDELSGTLPDLATAATAGGGRRSVSREREALRGPSQPPLPRADVLREGGGATPVICAFIIFWPCAARPIPPTFFGPALRAPSPHFFGPALRAPSPPPSGVSCQTLGIILLYVNVNSLHYLIQPVTI